MKVVSLAASALLCAAASELVAERLGPRLMPALPVGTSEAAQKLHLLREHRRSGVSPKVLIVGASPTGTALDPGIIASRGVNARVFNACLSGTTVPELRSWWEIWRHEARPDVVLVEAMPLMFIPSGNFSDTLARSLASIHKSYSRTSVDHPLAVWRWRKELTSMLLGRVGPYEHLPALDERQIEQMTRFRPDGFRDAYLDVALEDGLAPFKGDWYGKRGIDPRAVPDYGPYLEFTNELREVGIQPVAVLPPLRLSANDFMSLGADAARRIGDDLLTAAAAQSLAAIDLRPVADRDEDFADAFHLRRQASRRVSEQCGDALLSIAPHLADESNLLPKWSSSCRQGCRR